MSFIQPMLLVALPLVALPIIIHLINQRRYQTINWAAMMFLLAANRMSRGYAKLRQWLILLFRMLAVAGIIFAVSRPLASGWLGLTAGGSADTTLILIDRSPSMQQTGAGGAATKLDTALASLTSTLSNLGSSHWVLIDSVTCQPTELESPAALQKSHAAEPTSAAADLPAMLQAAYDYIKANQTGRTEVWICSDLRANDWNPQSARWQSLRDAFLEFPQSVRFHLHGYPDAAPGNLSVRVTKVRHRLTDDEADLLVSLKLSREGGSEKLSVPLQFEIDGARSESTFEMTGPEFELVDHRIPLAKKQQRGWGRVSVAADVNPADNDFYFAYDEAPTRQTLIVADDPQAARPLQLAAEITPDPAINSRAEVIGVEQLATVEWEKVALVLWQAAVPTGDAAALVRSFVARGGQVIFFPPDSPDATELFGVRWQPAVTAPEDISVETWLGDQDLLAHTQSGAALPVGDLHIRKYYPLTGEFTALAKLHGGAPLLARVTTDRGGVYFCTTAPSGRDSSLAVDGVVLYVAVQRALAAGAAVLDNTRQIIAGELPADAGSGWQPLAGADGALSSEYPFHRGVYSDGERIVAVNRPAAEDQAAVLSDAGAKELFRGLDFDRVDGAAGSAGSLAYEIWRMFLCAMVVAMVVEAGLCLPKVARAPGPGGRP